MIKISDKFSMLDLMKGRTEESVKSRICLTTFFLLIRRMMVSGRKLYVLTEMTKLHHIVNIINVAKMFASKIYP